MAMMTRISLLAATLALTACPRPQDPKDPSDDPGPADEGETGTDQHTNEPSAETKPA